ncbi:acetylcholinesterase-like [Brevipalpus obovatus]|uniref:acetylcholinesterase-like n=1 Tax=Brevipalpus obovatus TaxID=246614 RepID=UPI003D9F4D25
MSQKKKLVNFYSISVFLLFFLCISVWPCKAQDCKVTTKSGPIVGTVIDVLDKKICKFLGVPFAKPPVGELRFKKPEPIDPWTEPLDCTQKKPYCLQFKFNLSELGFDVAKETEGREIVAGPIKILTEMTELEASEDCLYMDIYSPIDTAADKKYSMVVFIHEGMFVNGGAGIPSYDPSVLVARGDVIFGIPQYRLGCLGFLFSGTPSAPGNMGLWDQLEGVKWMKTNAESFGGNPESITLMGQDSGGWSVGYHTLSVAGEGFFQQAIMQSGSALNLFMLFGENSALYRFERFVDITGCPLAPKAENAEFRVATEETFKCLQSKTSDEMLAFQKTLMTGRKDVGCVPNEDKEFFGTNPFDKIKSGPFNAKAVLMGSNSNEGGIMYSSSMGDAAPMFKGEPKPLTLNDMINMIKEKSDGSGSSQMQMVMPMFYRGLNKDNPEEVRARSQQLIGDGLFVCPDQLYVTGCAKVDNCKAYYYLFDHKPSNSLFAPWLEGSQHFDDVPFVFGKPLIMPDKYTPEEKDMSGKMIDMWLKFIKTGDPNLDKTGWKPNAGKSKGYMVISGKAIKGAKGFPKNNCKDLSRYYGMGRSFLKSYNPDKKKES